MGVSYKEMSLLKIKEVAGAITRTPKMVVDQLARYE